MTAQQILDRIPDVKVLVVGDICLDRWCQYDPFLAEPSRETGLERVAVTFTEVTPGAGGTVSSNLAALGAREIRVLGIAGDDGHGYELRQALTKRGIDSSLLVTGPVTFTYTKLLNSRTGVEDLGRIDYVSFPPQAEVEDELIRRLEEAAPQHDCVMVADQMETAAGGVVTARVRECLTRLAAAHPKLLIWVDSRMRIEQFRGVTVKPNEREAREACERLGIEVNYQKLSDTVGGPLMMVTHGGEGVSVLHQGTEVRIATRPVAHPVDICGAGDSFSAGALLALCAGATPVEAARFGNYVASVTIMKPGTGTASPAEVLRAEKEQAG
ncbi:MAG TPA: PfkB family carbohydrate kinase [Paludibaculum sp.]|jgi:rfaE bifunctional protein kinase chain/domain